MILIESSTQAHAAQLSLMYTLAPQTATDTFQNHGQRHEPCARQLYKTSRLTFCQNGKQIKLVFYWSRQPHRSKQSNILSRVLFTLREEDGLSRVHAGEWHDVQIGESCLVCIGDGQKFFQVTNLRIYLVPPCLRSPLCRTVHFLR